MSSGGLLDEQFNNTARNLSFTLLGESVTYTASNAPGVSPTATAITAVRIPTPDVVESDLDEKTKFVIQASDISDPLEGDTVTDDAGLKWGVTRVTPQEGGVFVLSCLHSKEQ